MSAKRAELEKAAASAVQSSGLQSLSFRKLADQVGVKSSSVHYYFPEKGDLAAALIKNYTDAFAQQLADIDRRQLPLAERMEAFVKLFEDVSRAGEFCLCGMMAAEITSLSERNSALLADFFVLVEGWLLTQLNEHPTLPKSATPPAMLVKLILSGLEGALLLDRVNNTMVRLHAQRDWIRQLLV